MVIYIGHQVEKATRVFSGRCSAYKPMGRAHSITRRWRVERSQAYNLEDMEEECKFDN